MDKKLTKLHKNTRDLSPINSKKNLLFSSNKKREKEAKSREKSPVQSNKPSKTTTFNKKENNSTDPPTLTNTYQKTSNGANDKNKKIAYPKNINEYRHIFSNFQTVKAEMSWILDLRSHPDKLKYLGLKQVQDVNPRMYSDTINDFKKKMEQERELRKNNFQLPTGNSNNYIHLVQDRLGATANASQFSFETTLRSFRPKSNCVQSSEWKGASNVHKPRLFSSYIGNNGVQSNFGNKFNTNLKAYEIVYDEVVIGDQKIRRKKLQPSKDLLMDFLGEHEGLEKYDFKYDTKNINDVKHILKYHSNSMARFENGLRSYRAENENLREGAHTSYNKVRGDNNMNNNDIKDQSESKSDM